MSERRVPFFERPAPPHDWRWKVSLVGRTFIVLGLLMFGFVAYQLWGTGIQTAQAQHTLDQQFADQLKGTTTVPVTVSTTLAPTSTSTGPGSTAVTTTTPATTSTLPTAPAGPLPANGTAVARLKIESIGLTYTVVQGVGVADLKKGPGHFPETPMPGQYGNAAIAGHRTTYGHPFYKLDKVKVGDEIQVDTLVGTYVYAVTGTRVVSPAQYAEVIPTVDPSVATLTLATCTPAYTARQRLIVFATLVPGKSGVVYQPSALGSGNGGLPGDGTDNSSTTSTAGTSTTQATSGSTNSAPSTTAAVTATTVASKPAPTAASDAFSSGWFDDGSAIPHVLAWGALLVGVCIGAFRIGRRANRLWVSVAVGVVPFLVVLYFFFENVNRLLPSSI